MLPGVINGLQYYKYVNYDHPGESSSEFRQPQQKSSSESSE